MLKHKPKTIFLLLSIVMLLTTTILGPQPGIADGDIHTAEIDQGNKRVVLGSDDFMLEVHGGGQVPFYHFNVSEIRFFLKLQQMVQYKDNNENGRFDDGEQVGGQASTLQLPSVKWDLEVITNTNTEIEFILTSAQINDPLFNNVQIELFNHYSAGDTAIKFDVKISDWPFAAEATDLSLEFELTWSMGSGDDDSTRTLTKDSDGSNIYLKNENDVIFAYFEIISEITIDGTTTDTATLHDTAVQQAKKFNLFINYPKFSTSLEHDPEFGTSSDALKSPTAIVLWIEENVKAGFLGLTVISTLILTALVAVTRTKRSR
jgi:hypothetical protein